VKSVIYYSLSNTHTLMALSWAALLLGSTDHHVDAQQMEMDLSSIDSSRFLDHLSVPPHSRCFALSNPLLWFFITVLLSVP
jgi:hypothetical protein